MLQNDYQYALSLYKDDGTPLGQAAAAVDFGPAWEWTTFQGVRRGELPADEAPAQSTVTPIWQPRTGPPYLVGFRVSISASGGRQVTGDFPTSYFEGLAHQASACYLQEGQLQAGELFRYLVSAVPRQAAEPQGSTVPVSVKTISPPVPLKGEKEAAALFQESAPFGEMDEVDAPVFIPQHILDETAQLTRQARAKETGGVLIGHLYRDAHTPEIFVEVTAQIPARYAHSQLTRLTFTAETWTAVQAAIDLRRRGEIMLGWWHSHAYLHEKCRACEKRADQSCKAAATFMSAEDCALHRTVFPRAYSVALVISDSPCSGLTTALFGWRCGVVTTRGFHILRASRPNVGVGAPVATGGNEHGTW